MVTTNHFMKRLPDNVRRDVIMTSKLKQFKADTYVFKQGEQGTSMFIILQGSVNVVIDATNQKSLVPIEVVAFVFHLRF